MGEWARALITGASAGIGREIVRQLTADGTDVVLVARRESRLRDLADEVAAAHGVHAEVLPADLGDAEDLARVEARVSDRAEPVDLLVNNAGFAHLGDVADRSVDDLEDMVRVNSLAPLRLSHAAAVRMRDAGRGGILNVSSGVAFFPGPGMATYGATKAFVNSFTEALAEELRGTGVRVSCLCPGFTDTEFQDRSHYDTSSIPGIAWTSAEDVARTGLAGVAGGRDVVIAGLLYRVGLGVVRHVPRRIMAGITRRMS